MGASEKFPKPGVKPEASAAKPWRLSNFDDNAHVAGASRLSARPNEAQETQRGFEAGKKQGLAEGVAEIQRMLRQTRAADLQRVEALIANLGQEITLAVRELDERTADRLLDLALDIASRVIGSEVRQRRDLMLPIVHEALDTIISGHSHPTIHVSPADHDWLRTAADQDARLHGCRLVADASLPLGTCRIETTQALVDASIPTRWQHVLRGLGCEPLEHPLVIAEPPDEPSS
jgi:flagellar assembly protein FliH